jgi:uncharacterized membrane protein HdeD (DUF308 family)
MNSMLSGVLALLTGLATVFSFWQFQSKSGGTLYIVLGIVCLIATIVLGATFLMGRVNKTEDIHITE